MSHRTSTSRDHPGSVLERDTGRPVAAPSGGNIDGDVTTTLITDLPYGPRAAAVARDAVAVALHGTEPYLLDNARLIGSELATNAFASGSPPLVMCVDRRFSPTGGLEVEITITDGGCSRSAPASPPAPQEEAESGRGLVIVEALADAWSLTTGAHGTRAWCRLAHSALHSAAEPD
ncbi:ATP-binding protein [Streptomyces montanisoli]|uniref:ATP-binding protein n=1 Tax=Streptomyces montanisoli TaxID=2798581 RepID=A0A940MEK2_9ACTN|nr:ATP-binding protein [Streptomyces montanisoli]MBP0459602.1 ATP-binding protein [Streptomyces montanisoli]